MGLFDDSIKASAGIFSDGVGLSALARMGLRFIGLGFAWFIMCMCSGVVGIFTALYGILMPLYITYVVNVTNNKMNMGGLWTFMTKLMEAKQNYFIWMTLGVMLWIVSDIWGGMGTVALVSSCIIMVAAGVLLHTNANKPLPMAVESME
jgi:hypothetical protein